jgi:hypothetical protein
MKSLLKRKQIALRLTDLSIGCFVRTKKFVNLLAQFLVILNNIDREQPKMIWIGDSHSRYINGSGQSAKRYEATKSSELVIWVGPRLLYSIAKKGFRLNPLDRKLLRRFGKDSTCVFVFGEIDCRAHLASGFRFMDQEELTTISEEYKNQILELASRYNFSHCIVVSPIPPSNFGLIDPKFPRVGSLDERVLATNALTNSLTKLGEQNFAILDLSSFLASEDGTLNPSYSQDGVHVNSVGATIIRNRLRVDKEADC